MAWILVGGRIANANRVWQAAQDADVTSWNKANDFIVAAMLESSAHAGDSGTIQLQWRNVTDGGSFANLSAAGELTWSAVTDLVNGNAVVHTEEGVTPIQATHDDGVEREGANDIAVTIALKTIHEEEQWAVDCNNAHDGDNYEFRLWDATASAAVGTLLCDITIAAAPTRIPRPPAQGLDPMFF